MKRMLKAGVCVGSLAASLPFGTGFARADIVLQLDVTTAVTHGFFSGGSVFPTVTGTKGCVATSLGADGPGGFLAQVDAGCFDGFLVSGGGYGTIDENILIDPISFKVGSDTRFVADPTQLRNPAFTKTFTDTAYDPSEPAFLNLFDATKYPCPKITIGVGPTGGGGYVGTVPTGCSFSLVPTSASGIIGTTHTVTATVLDPVTSAPVTGAAISFGVAAGPNASTAATTTGGTCAPANCRTQADGTVSWTYTGTGGVGTDTIVAFEDLNSNGVIDSGEPNAAAKATWGLPSSIAWDAVASPPASYPYCVADGTAGTVQPGRCFADQAAATVFIRGNGWREGLRVPSATWSATIAVSGCTAAWMSLTGTWFEHENGAFTSSCPLALSADGAPGQPLDPSHAQVVYVTTATRLPINPNPSTTLGRELALFDPGRPAGSFASPALRFADSDRDKPVTVDEGTNLATSSQYDVTAMATSVAYSSSTRPDATARKLKIDPFGQLVFVTPTVNAQIQPVNDRIAEEDVIWSWIPNGTPGKIDPGAPFDVLVRPVLQPLQLLSFGDSYAAGEGATGSNDHPCARSPFSYSGSIVQLSLFDKTRTQEGQRMRDLVSDVNDPNTMYRQGNGAQWGYIACGGATARNIWSANWHAPDDPGQGSQLPQRPGFPPDDRTQLANPAIGSVWKPNAVTLTIGGNDAGFASVVTTCFENHLKYLAAKAHFFPFPVQEVSCERAFQDIATIDDPISGAYSFNPNGLTPDGAPDDHSGGYLEKVIRPRLAETYRQITSTIQGLNLDHPVPVTVFGYPTLIDPGCHEAEMAGDTNRQWLAGIVGRADTVIREEATKAGFTYVSPDEFSGHAICDSDPYVNGLILDGNVPYSPGWIDLLFPIAGVRAPESPDHKSFHPNDKGWQAYTDGWARMNQGTGQRLANGMLAPAPQPTAEAPIANRASAVASASPPAAAAVASPATAGPGATINITTAQQCGARVADLRSPMAVSVQGAKPGSTATLAAMSLTDFTRVTSTPIAVSGSGTARGSYTLDRLAGPTVVTVAVTAPDGSISTPASAAADFSGTGRHSCANPIVAHPDLEPGTSLIDVLGQSERDDQSHGGGDDHDRPRWNRASLVVVEQPVSGVATVRNGSILYTPNPGFRYIDHFQYGVCDAKGLCSSATVTVDYTPHCTIVGDAPGLIVGTPGDDVICGSDAFHVIEGRGGRDIVYPGGGHDRIDLGDSSGRLERSANTGLIVANPRVKITGAPGGPPPVIVEPGRPTLHDVAVTSATNVVVARPLTGATSLTPLDLASFRVTAIPDTLQVQDVSVDGGGLRVTFRSRQPAHAAPITYRVCDVNRRCQSATIMVTTGTSPAVAPIAKDRTVTVDPAGSTSFDLSGDVTDLNGGLDLASLSVLHPPATGTATAGRNGLTYQAPVVFSGQAPIGYRICDVAGLCAEATITVVVAPYQFSGFGPPIQPEPARNSARPGGTIALSFSLGGDHRRNIIAPGSPTSQPAPCGTQPASQIHNDDSVGADDHDAALTFNSATNTYTYHWKTSETWTGCRELTLRLADGTTHTALFDFGCHGDDRDRSCRSGG